jgi:hypothetical protein
VGAGESVHEHQWRIAAAVFLVEKPACLDIE